jgi:hypothetical protein
MTKTPKRPRDVSQLAKMMVDIASGEVGEAVAPSPGNKRHVGGKKGGKARAKALPPESRTDIARMAALARWKKSD